MNIDIDSEWRDKINCQLTVKVKVVDSRFVYGKSSLGCVYQAGSNASLIEDLKTAAWYAERSWKRNKCRNNRVHWLVQRKGEAIADSRDEQGQPFIAEVMRNIVNNRYWQAYDSLMTEIERLESGEVN